MAELAPIGGGVSTVAVPKITVPAAAKVSAPVTAAARAAANPIGNPFPKGSPGYVRYQQVVGGEIKATGQNNTKATGAPLPASVVGSLAPVSGTKVAASAPISSQPPIKTTDVDAAIKAALLGGLSSGNFDGQSMLDTILGNLDSGKYTTTTKSPSAVTAASPTSGGTTLAPVNVGTRVGDVTIGDLAEVGKQYHWTPEDEDAALKIVQLESGGNPTVVNKSSGAYGIGQFLGSTAKEYAPYGALSGQTMPELVAFAKYITDRYGSPTNALSFHLAHGWY